MYTALYYCYIILTNPLLPIKVFFKVNLLLFQITINFNIQDIKKSIGIYWLTDTGGFILQNIKKIISHRLDKSVINVEGIFYHNKMQ